MLLQPHGYYPSFTKGTVELSNCIYERWYPKDDNEIKLALAKRHLTANKGILYKCLTPQPNRETDEDFIKYFDESMAPLLREDDEIIKRKDWPRYEDMLGEKLEILNHPVFEKMAAYIRTHNHKTSDLLVASSCGKRKPYSQNPGFSGLIHPKVYVPKLNGMYDGVVLSNSGVIPIDHGNDFSYCYPFRYYDWDHGKEEELGIIQNVEDKMHDYLKAFIEANGYTKVAIASGRTYPSYYNIYNRLVKELPNVDFYWPINEENLNRYMERSGFMTDAQKARARYVMRPRYQRSFHLIADILRHYNGEIIPEFQAYLDEQSKRQAKTRARKKAKKEAKRNPGATLESLGMFG